MDTIEVSEAAVRASAQAAGMDLNEVYATDVMRLYGKRAPAWRLRATGDQLVIFAAELIEHYAELLTSTGPEDAHRRAVQFVAELGKRVRMSLYADEGEGMILNVAGSVLVPDEPQVTEGEVTVYRSGPSASWQLIGSDTPFAAATDLDAVLAEAARQAIDRPGLVIRYQDKGGLSARQAARQQSANEFEINDAQLSSALDNYDE